MQSLRSMYVPKLLQTGTHVFVWDLAKSKTLQPSYRGPFKILKKHPKFIEVEILKLPRNIPVDGLKPTSLDTTWLSMNTSVIPPPAPNDLKVTDQVWP